MRILKRNGKEKLQDFLNKWIPVEEHYFAELEIRNQCNLILDTTMMTIQMNCGVILAPALPTNSNLYWKEYTI